MKAKEYLFRIADLPQLELPILFPNFPVSDEISETEESDEEDEEIFEEEIETDYELYYEMNHEEEEYGYGIPQP